MAQIKSGDILGAVVVLAGIAVILANVSVPAPLSSGVVGLLLVVLGLAASFGAGTFRAVVDRLLDERAGGSDDETSTSGSN